MKRLVILCLSLVAMCGAGEAVGPIAKMDFKGDGYVYLTIKGDKTGNPSCSQTPRFRLDAKSPSGDVYLEGLIAAFQSKATVRVTGTGKCDMYPNPDTEILSSYSMEIP